MALSQSSELLRNPYVIIPGATYDVEMINGLSYLMEQGKIRDGDTIGHIWADGEYGANGLRGAQYFAQKHNLTVRDAKVNAPDSDLRNVMTGFAGDPRVTAIALTTTPAQTASAAEVNQQLGLNVIWGQLLQRACNNGDLTRAGIQEALPQSTDITTDALVADLDFTKPGAPAAREVYVGVPNATVPGGIRQVKPLFVAPEAQSYAAPHQNGD